MLRLRHMCPQIIHARAYTHEAQIGDTSVQPPRPLCPHACCNTLNNCHGSGIGVRQVPMCHLL